MDNEEFTELMRDLKVPDENIKGYYVKTIKDPTNYTWKLGQVYRFFMEEDGFPIEKLTAFVIMGTEHLEFVDVDTFFMQDIEQIDYWINHGIVQEITIVND